MQGCGHYTGPTTAMGQRIAVFCPQDTIGRIVQIQIVKGNSNYLSAAEVLVWGVKATWKKQNLIKMNPNDLSPFIFKVIYWIKIDFASIWFFFVSLCFDYDKVNQNRYKKYDNSKGRGLHVLSIYIQVIY